MERGDAERLKVKVCRVLRSPLGIALISANSISKLVSGSVGTASVTSIRSTDGYRAELIDRSGK